MTVGDNDSIGGSAAHLLAASFLAMIQGYAQPGSVAGCDSPVLPRLLHLRWTYRCAKTLSHTRGTSNHQSGGANVLNTVLGPQRARVLIPRRGTLITYNVQYLLGNLPTSPFHRAQPVSVTPTAGAGNDKINFHLNDHHAWRIWA